MKNKINATILLLVLSLGTISSQSFDKQKLDSLFNVLIEKDKAMGSVAISKNGKQIYSRAIGYSFITDSIKIPATTNTKYRIGSISKMFTATIILQLVEEGKTKLTANLDTYFPKLPNANKITIGNLLNHRSGLHDFTSDSAYSTWMTQPKTEDELLSIITKGGADFHPNEKFAYSNPNYIILGYIIEKICKKPYKDILKERVISKIGLVNTYYGDKTDLKNNECYSYQHVSNWEQQPETDMSIPGGAGALVSTPTDLAKFMEALFSMKLITKNSLIQMKTMIDGYGMGMYQIPFYNKKAYGHNGGIDGFVSNLAYFPEDSLTVAYCSNGQIYPINDILIGVLSICFNKDYTIPTFKTITLKSEDLDKYLGVYSSPEIPLKITISKDKTILIAQATGQSSFALEATEKDKFKFDQAGVIMEFNADKKELTMKQGGGSYLFTMDK
ncbi:MAG: serine hydrolase domain-containing protein [Bacteroidota bacterium]